VADSGLPIRTRLALIIQRELGRLVSIITIPLVGFWLRFALRYRIQNVEEVRRRFREILKDGRPLLICANHLTMVDSFIASWALGSCPWYLFHFSALPWHVPERKNFADTWYNYLLVYLMKCVPIERGGDRKQVSRVLRRLIYLLTIGQVVFVFPEGTRSRTGRVQPGSAAYGVGRIINSVPDIRTLCVYLRGDHQDTWGEMPVRGESFRVDLSVIEPKSDKRGMRRSRELAVQTLTELIEMEQRYFDSRQ
jgi:hypothetical protein